MTKRMWNLKSKNSKFSQPIKLFNKTFLMHATNNASYEAIKSERVNKSNQKF